MPRFLCSLAVLMVMAFPLTAVANFWSSCPQTVSYYYEIPVVYAPPPVYCVGPYAGPLGQPPRVVTPAPAPRLLANPSAAPPSSEREPPVAPPSKPAPRPGETMPRVMESNFYDVYPVTSREGTKPTGDSYPIGIWNLSNTDLIVKVAGQPHTLPRNKNLQLHVGRQFVWQVEGREAQVERIPAGESALEIVIRR